MIRLWEQPTAIFQQYQGLLPFATLPQTNAPEETLRQVAKGKAKGLAEGLAKGKAEEKNQIALNMLLSNISG